jgi:hypothetical protein
MRPIDLGSLHHALVLRSGAMRRRLSKKDAPERTYGATFWIILRDAALRTAPQDEAGCGDQRQQPN